MRHSALQVCVFNVMKYDWYSKFTSLLLVHGPFRIEKFQLDEIQNGRLAAVIDFNLRNIWKTVPDI